MENIQDVICNIKHTVETHFIGTGAYARWLWQDEKGTRKLGVNPYGCADAANILYTIGEFPGGEEERRAWVETLWQMQDQKTGLFFEKTHHPFHTTAHCVAALELFDTKPLYPLTAMHPYLEEGKLEEFLESLDWKRNPWPQSHQGAGIFAAMNNAGEATPEWNQRYFHWLWEHADPETGLWKKGEMDGPNARPLFEHMAGTFHYLFNHEYAHMPLRYPDKLIDSCIEMYDTTHLRPDFGKVAGFLEIDWVYCMSRASRQTPHRFEEVRDRLRRFRDEYVAFFRTVDWEKDDAINDLHMLFGAVCALAELQQSLRGELLTDRPLRLVLDRRPFI